MDYGERKMKKKSSYEWFLPNEMNLFHVSFNLVSDLDFLGYHIQPHISALKYNELLLWQLFSCIIFDFRACEFIFT